MNNVSDIIIVGAGIVGAACARSLSREGLSVTIVDAEIIGGGATAAGMGHIVVIDDDPAEFALTHYSQQLWHDIAAVLPADCECDPFGTLWIAADDDELTAARAKGASLATRDVASELLDAKQLAAAEPQLRKGLTGGLLVPGDLVVYPPCAARWMIEQAQAHGATVRLNEAVAFAGGDRVLLTDGTSLSAGCVINAAGVAAAQLTPGVPIRPRKGHLAITDRSPGFIRHQLIELGYIKNAHGSSAESVAFNVQPRHTGQLLIGSSRQFDDESSQVEANVLGTMLHRAFEYLPELFKLHVVRTWTGLRATTPDNRPLIGPWPQVPGLLLATGHEGLGITTSLATAELITDHLLGRASKIPREPYLPARFLEMQQA